MNQITSDLYWLKRKQGFPARFALERAKAEKAYYQMDLGKGRVFRLEFPYSATKKELVRFIRVVEQLAFDLTKNK